MTSNKNAWTPDELNKLTIYYGTMPNADLHTKHLPNRNVRAIELKAMKMGLTKPRHQRYTDKELNILKQFSNNLTPQQIQEQFIPNRSARSIETKIRDLQKPKNKKPMNQSNQGPRLPWSKAEMDILRKYYNTMSVPAIQSAYLPNRSTHAIENMARVILPKKSTQWTHSERAILKRYYPKMPTRELIEKYLPNKTINQVEHAAYRRGLHKNY